jgi:hypothetical protein
MSDDVLRFLEVVDENQAICARGSYAGPDGATVDIRAALDAAVTATTLLTEATLDALVEVKPRPIHRRGPRSSIGMSVSAAARVPAPCSTRGRRGWRSSTTPTA